jgi:vacuolar-type H+-ATPase subunit I/STV1
MINKVGKTLTIFIVLIIILLLSSTCIGFYLYHLEEALHKKVEIELDNSRADGLKLQAQLKDVQGQLALSEDKNKEADAKINNLLDERDLNEGLRAALKKENTGLKEQIVVIDKSKQKLKVDLDDAVSKLTQFQELLKAFQDKTKELETRLAGLVETNKSYETKIKELMAAASAAASVKPMTPAVVPPVGIGKNKVELGKIVVKPQVGTQGHILAVDTQAEFVIFNLGLKQGITPDDLLSVFRGNDYLGDIKATRVQDEMSAADIVPPLSSKDISKNDTVVLKP